MSDANGLTEKLEELIGAIRGTREMIVADQTQEALDQFALSMQRFAADLP